MGFRSRQSNHDGFGIQKNSNRKTVNKRKKKRKTSVPKKQIDPSMKLSADKKELLTEEQFNERYLDKKNLRRMNKGKSFNLSDAYHTEQGMIKQDDGTFLDPNTHHMSSFSKDYYSSEDGKETNTIESFLGDTNQNTGEVMYEHSRLVTGPDGEQVEESVFYTLPKDGYGAKMVTSSKYGTKETILTPEEVKELYDKYYMNKAVPNLQNAANLPVGEEISSTLPEGMESSMSPSTFDDKVQAELDLAQLNGYIEQTGITGEESKKLLAEYLMKELQNQNRMG